MNISEAISIVWFVFALGLSTYSMIFVVGLFIKEAVNTINEMNRKVNDMRWKKKENKYLDDGETRVVTRFLLFPKELNNEYRWLEFARIRQLYLEYDFERDVGGYWVDKEWC